MVDYYDDCDCYVSVNSILDSFEDGDRMATEMLYSWHDSVWEDDCGMYDYEGYDSGFFFRDYDYDRNADLISDMSASYDSMRDY